MLSGLLQAAATTCFILAISKTTVSNTVVILAAAPAVAAVIARLAIGEQTTIRTWLAIAATMGGVLVVVSGSFGSGQLSGDIFAVGDILAFATNLTLWRKYPAMDRMAAIGLGGIIMALISAIPANPVGVDTRAWLILLLLGGIIGPAGRIAVATSTRYLPAAQVSLFGPVETIAATAWAWLFLGEMPAALTMTGGVIILAAVTYGSTRQPQSR